MGNTIDYFLGRAYASELLGKGSHAVTMKHFIRICGKGTQFEKEVNRRIAQLGPLKGRCFVSGKHLEYLTRILTN